MNHLIHETRQVIHMCILIASNFYLKSMNKWNALLHKFSHWCMHTCVCTQSCLTVCNSTDCSTPGSSVHGIFQAKILEWVAISFFRGSSQPRDRTHNSCVSCISWWVLYQLSPGKPCHWWLTIKFKQNKSAQPKLLTTYCKDTYH